MHKVISNYTQKVTVPTAFVTKGRQRVKQYYSNQTTIGQVYLKNGDEFEIELFNPTSNKVLAKVKINGNISSSGIVVRPGERVFLERYLDETKKFLFETYEVDGTDSNVQNAIKNNGDLEIEFHDTYQPTCIPWIPTSGTWTIQPSTPTVYYYNSNSTIGQAQRCSSVTSKGINTASFICNCNNNYNAASYDLASYEANYSGDIQMDGYMANINNVETGRVEKGSNSDQSFMYDSTNFNSYYTWKSVWKILPDSQRPVLKEDLKVYCTNCGAKRKKDSFKFCPNCGNKF